MEMELILRILTLNCWGIPLISKDRKLRMHAIADAFSKLNYDVICLQEVWSDSDYKLIKDKIKNILPHSHYFYSGVLGSGICVFSKYPILEVYFHQWPVNGYIHKIQHADWFGGKGVVLFRLRIRDFNINIYSAHLHAEYDRNNDEYASHRVLQAFDTAQFVKLTSYNSDVVILAGDLNTEPGDLAYHLLLKCTGLIDSYTKSNTSVSASGTNERCSNSYTDPELVAKQFQGKRIDYILYRKISNIKVTLESYEHPLPERIPNHVISYSDHEAVSATLKLERQSHLLSKSKSEPEPIETDLDSKDSESESESKSVLIESIQVLDTALGNLSYKKRFYLAVSLVLVTTLVITVGMDAPFNYAILGHVVRALVTGVLCYTLVMATLWNCIETNAILAGKLNMEISLKHVQNVEKTL